MNPADSVRQLLSEGIIEVFSGAVVWVAEAGRVVLHEAAGTLRTRPDPAELVRQDTLFDIASLTKPMATVTLLMREVAEKRLDTATPLADLIPEFAAPGSDPRRRQVTLQHLLTHASGLPAWRPFYETLRAESPTLFGTQAAWPWYVSQVAQEPLEYDPGVKSVYSDLGFILLGEALARATGTPFESLFIERVAAPLGLARTGFNAGNVPRRFSNVAATSDVPWRGGVISGVVHDDNAYAMGGVAGHAGLFSTAEEVGRWAQALLDAWQGRRSNFIAPAVAGRFLARNATVPGSTWALGFDTPSPSSSSGHYTSPRAVGHLGFCGTSVWIDPERDWIVVLLTNRVHPSPENRSIDRFRPRLHDTVARALWKNPHAFRAG